jgi:hypothetical protein
MARPRGGELAALDNKRIDSGVVDDEGVVVLGGERVQRRVAQPHDRGGADDGPGFDAIAREHGHRVALLQAERAEERHHPADGLAQLAIGPARALVGDGGFVGVAKNRADDQGRPARRPHKGSTCLSSPTFLVGGQASAAQAGAPRRFQRAAKRGRGVADGIDDDELTHLAAQEGLQEGVVVAERDAAVRIAAGPKHIGVGEQAGAAEDRARAADRVKADGAHAVEQRFAHAQIVDMRRRHAAHAQVGVIRIVAHGAEAGMRLEPRAVGHMHELGGDVVDRPAAAGAWRGRIRRGGARRDGAGVVGAARRAPHKAMAGPSGARALPNRRSKKDGSARACVIGAFRTRAREAKRWRGCSGRGVKAGARSPGRLGGSGTVSSDAASARRSGGAGAASMASATGVGFVRVATVSGAAGAIAGASHAAARSMAALSKDGAARPSE